MRTSHWLPCLCLCFQVQQHWVSYMEKLDRMVEDAFRVNIKRSLQELSKAINGDGKTSPNPLFKVEVVLKQQTPRYPAQVHTNRHRHFLFVKSSNAVVIENNLRDEVTLTSHLDNVFSNIPSPLWFQGIKVYIKALCQCKSLCWSQRAAGHVFYIQRKDTIIHQAEGIQNTATSINHSCGCTAALFSTPLYCYG